MAGLKLNAYPARAAALAAARHWAGEMQATLVCPSQPLLGEYSVQENLALVRQTAGGLPAWRAHPLAVATLERAGVRNLAGHAAGELSARDALTVKCLAAAMAPNGHAAIVGSGHLADAQAETAAIVHLVRLFADRWRRCEIFVEEDRAEIFRIL